MAVLKNCWAGFFEYSKNVYVNCGSHSVFNFHPGQNSFSIQAWVRFLADGGGIIVAKGTSSAIQYGFEVYSGSIISYIGGDSFSDHVNATLGFAIDNNQWHHIVYVVDASSKKLSLYVDAQLLNVYSYTGETTVKADLLIGARRNSSNSDAANYLTGYCDEVGIWSSALSTAEVVALYNNGFGMMLDIDAGNYTSAANLEGWWRMGDGSTEHAGTASATFTIADESGHTRHGILNTTDSDPSSFYYGNAPYTVVGESYCFTLISSSAIFPEAGPSFTITRKDQGNLYDVIGQEGNMFRMVLECTSTPGVENKIFVYEHGRPFVGTTVRTKVFRRVATLQDLLSIPADTPLPYFPFAYRTNVAEVYATSADQLDQIWLEIQRQAALLSFDMKEFGAATSEGVFRGGENNLIQAGQGTFGAAIPTPISTPKSSSSSSRAIVEPLVSSSSSSVTFKLSSSSSSLFIPLESSSSLFIDPHLFSDIEFTIENKTTDAISIFNNAGAKTLISGMDFIRFGRNLDPEQTWDAFLRFKVQIPKCANILQAELKLAFKSTETGEDVILKINEIYEDSNLTSVQAFNSINKNYYIANSIPWTYLYQATAATTTPDLGPIPDLTKIVQSFVNRPNHNPNGDYLGLWIQEVVSDPGARRDADLSLEGYPKLVVTYRDDSYCSSSAVQ